MSAEEKLYVISPTETGEQIADICHNVRLAQGSECTIRDNANRTIETATSGTKQFVCASRLPQSCWNKPYHTIMDVGLLHFYCIRNKYVVQKFMNV
jgi:hypothetical protein